MLTLTTILLLASLSSPASAVLPAAIQEADASDPAQVERPEVTWMRLKRRRGAYALVEPVGADPREPRPVVVALPPGEQDARMVSLSLELYWAAEAVARGWTVVAPRFDELDEFYPDAQTVLGAVLADVRAKFALEGDRFYLAGVSNGGRSAFEAALLSPQSWHALLAAPGFPAEGTDTAALEELVQLPVSMFVGGDDLAWSIPMVVTRDRLEQLEAEVRLTSFPGEGHQPPSLTGKLLFDELERMRALVAERPRLDPEVALDDASDVPDAASAPDRPAVVAAPADAFTLAAQDDAPGRVLDAFHRAASRGDGETYFGSFAPDGVFLGTDPDEHWTVEGFRAFAEPHFSVGQGWTYIPRERQVTVSESGGVAWFHERLQNEIYGQVRGTGVLVLIDGTWRIAQYSLTFVVPNEVALDLAERIRADAKLEPARQGAGPKGGAQPQGGAAKGQGKAKGARGQEGGQGQGGQGSGARGAGATGAAGGNPRAGDEPAGKPARGKA